MREAVKMELIFTMVIETTSKMYEVVTAVQVAEVVLPKGLIGTPSVVRVAATVQTGKRSIVNMVPAWEEQDNIVVLEALMGFCIQAVVPEEVWIHIQQMVEPAEVEWPSMQDDC